MAKWHLFKYYQKQRVCMDWVDRPQNYESLYGILRLSQGSHLDNFPLRILQLGWIAFHSLTFQKKCLDFQSNKYKKLIPVLSCFCSGLQVTLAPGNAIHWVTCYPVNGQCRLFCPVLGIHQIDLFIWWTASSYTLPRTIFSPIDQLSLVNKMLIVEHQRPRTI